ncbi:hypothetical protein SLU01_31380 [Sporosarcina luteola]|uniref:Uncharacterized protein n=1 Tax=Sporosarcina luteola TaxID=582850 RepID=A0A511ZBK4_9BACL|nr:hypothetical protein SLU01_31380 [Sporosarcina luteola]
MLISLWKVDNLYKLVSYIARLAYLTIREIQRYICLQFVQDPSYIFCVKLVKEIRKVIFNL